jgi:hypothetical protein
MTWSKKLPEDTTKIRLLGQVLRPNWEAIEEGGATLKPWAINLANRDAVIPSISSDPAGVPKSYMLYSKVDALGRSELFGYSEQGIITQFTQGTPTKAQNGMTFLPGGIILKWGRITVSGINVITFPVPFPNAVYSVVVTQSTNTTQSSVKLYNQGVTGFTAQRSVTGEDSKFDYIAIGY